MALPAPMTELPLAAPAAPVVAPVQRRGLLLVGVGVLALAATLRFGAVPRADSVPPAEAERRAAAMKATPPLRLDPVRADETAAAWRSLALPAADLARLQAAAQAGRLHLVWLSLFDSDAVDGDRVTVSSLGLSQTVALTGQPTAIALPLPPSGRIAITATDEGRGGGVTVGVVAAGEVHKLPPMTVGQGFSLVVAVP